MKISKIEYPEVAILHIKKFIKSVLASPDPSEKNNVDFFKKDERRTLYFPAVSSDLPIEVRSNDGESLLTGKLTSFNLSELAIERLPGTFSLSILPTGKPVKVHCYDKDMEAVNISAKVQESTRFICWLEDLRLIPFSSNRAAPRFPLFNAPAQIFMANDTYMSNPTECKVLDISPIGARIVSEYCYPDDLPLRLRVELAKGCGPISFRCLIARAEMQKDNTFEYGVIFAQLDQRKQHELMMDMQKAREQLRKKIKG